MTKSACFCLLYPVLGKNNLEKNVQNYAPKNVQICAKKLQICAEIHKSGFVHFLDSFVSSHSVLIPWVEGSTFNNLQSLVQAGQILQWESIRKDNTFAMCAFQAQIGFEAVSFKMQLFYCKFSACCLYRPALEGSEYHYSIKCLWRSIT